MTTTTIRSERRLLMFSAAGNLVSAALGFTFATLTASQAVLLDGLFDIVYFLAALFTLKVARLVQREDDEHFPFGYAFFEPLVNGLKGVLVLGVCLVSLADASRALSTGGREIAAGLAMIYGGTAAVLCAVIAGLLRRRNRRLGSPLIRADAENWVVNGLISASVVLAFGSILILERSSLTRFAPYVDPLVVVAVVAASISLPVRMAWRALMEFLNRAPSPEVVAAVRAELTAAVADWPVRELFVRVVHPGRMRLVLVHLVLPENHPVPELRAFDELRSHALRRLQSLHPTTVLDMVFTGNRLWGAPTGVTQAASLTVEPSDESAERGSGTSS